MPASHIFLILLQKRLHIDVDQTMNNSANIWNFQKKNLNLQRKMIMVLAITNEISTQFIFERCLANIYLLR